MVDNINKDDAGQSGSGGTGVGATTKPGGMGGTNDSSSFGGSTSGASTNSNGGAMTGSTSTATLEPSSSDLAYAGNATGASGGSTHTEEAKSRFNAALAEAKAGVAALKSEAGTRASSYKDQALTRKDDYSKTAKEYGDQAKVKASELAVEGKAKASEALLALSRIVDDNAAAVDSSLGAKYGDYARTASRSLRDTAEKLEQKSVEQLGDDAREFLRTSPGAAVGIAAFAGFVLARIFGGSRK